MIKQNYFFDRKIKITEKGWTPDGRIIFRG